MRFFLIVLFVLYLFGFICGHAQDSTRIKTIDGKEFIEHRVQEKETLYSLSRKYDVPIYKIIELNPPTEFGLEIGTTINVPIRNNKRAESRTEQEEQLLKPESESDVDSRDVSFKELDIIRHTVETKQTLFSISRLYGVTIEEVRNWNNLSSNSLDIGQVLIIKKSHKAEEQPVVGMPSHTGNKVHIVETGETLYSLSKRFNVSIEDIKRFNGLVSNEISIGQELVVSGKIEPEAMTEKSDSTLLKSALGPADEDRDAINKAVESARKYEEELKPLNFEEIIESGVAEVIQGTDNTRKYLALHRTAKAGTILKVRNDMNDQEVFVRVLGKLPDNTSNSNVLIKLSQAAYKRLGAIDAKFRVTISYIP